MANVVTLTKRTIAERWKEVKEPDTIWGEISTETVALARRLLQSALEEELTVRLYAGPYVRSGRRQGWRNGGYWRQVASCWGRLDVWMPRARTKLPPSQVLDRFCRRQPEVDTLIRNAFLRGISTREVGEVLEPVLGWKPSAQTVSRIAQALDSQVGCFHRRRLRDDWCYLLLDGVTMKVKQAGGAKRRLVLVAYGIRATGTRQLIDFRLATAESSAQWEAFLADLFRRGLEGSQLQLIVTDGAPGLHAALELVYGLVPRQRCWAHKLRNVAALLPRKQQRACTRAAAPIYQAATRRAAWAAFKSWKAEWEPVAPKAVACLQRDLEELLSFLACPEPHRVVVRTTNGIERCFREVRRRTRPMSCFQNTKSCERIIFSVVTHLNTRWQDAPLRRFTQEA
jgi:putative transposase